MENQEVESTIVIHTNHFDGLQPSTSDNYVDFTCENLHKQNLDVLCRICGSIVTGYTYLVNDFMEELGEAL